MIQRMKYSSNRNVLVKHVDQPIKEIKEQLDSRVDSQMDKYEKELSKLEKKKPLELQRQATTVRKKAKPQSDLFEDKRATMKFYQEAKRLVTHSDDSFRDKDMVQARFA